jgi:hypothetical protein
MLRERALFLAAGDGDVDSPFVLAKVDRGEGRDGVDQKESRVSGRVDGAANGFDRADAAGRGFVMHDADRPDALGPVRAHRRFDGGRIGSAPPVRFD